MIHAGRAHCASSSCLPSPQLCVIVTLVPLLSRAGWGGRGLEHMAGGVGGTAVEASPSLPQVKSNSTPGSYPMVPAVLQVSPAMVPREPQTARVHVCVVPPDHGTLGGQPHHPSIRPALVPRLQLDL